MLRNVRDTSMLGGSAWIAAVLVLVPVLVLVGGRVAAEPNEGRASTQVNTTRASAGAQDMRDNVL